MTIVAFLQNQWVRDPERVRKMIERAGEKFRRRFISYALFAGCLTGRRLKSAFGDLTGQIVWEEVSREIGGKASDVFPADTRHIERELAELQPHLVLAFGSIAAGALGRCWTGPLLTGPHPAAREPGVQSKLAEMAALIPRYDRPLSSPAHVPAAEAATPTERPVPSDLQESPVEGKSRDSLCVPANSAAASRGQEGNGGGRCLTDCCMYHVDDHCALPSFACGERRL